VHVKVSVATAPGEIQVVDAPTPTVGPADVLCGSMGYPNEIFEVTEDLIANWEKYAVIASHTIPFDDVEQALKTASTPGAADKVVVTFN
jgi:hypothetical protein